MRASALLVSGALGVWLGLHALRSALMQVVWNVAEDATTTQLGLVAAAVWLVGLLGWIVARLVGGSVAWRLGALFALLTALRQTVTGEVPTAVFGIGGWIVWLWWFPAFLHELGRRGAASLAAPAVLLGLAAQVATQAALHGIDLHTLGGAAGAVGGVVLSVAFLIALRAALRPPAAASGGGVTWGALALGPYLFLQVTLLVNLARPQLLAGWDLPAAAALAASGIALGLLALRWSPPLRVRLLIGAVAVALLAALPLSPMAVLAVVPAQVGLALVLAGAFAAPGGASLGRAYLGAAVGAVLLFLFLFLFYSGDPLPALWPVASAVVVAVGARAARAEPQLESRPVLATLALAALAVGASLVPYPATARLGAPRVRDALTVLDYNIHQGIDLFGVPSVNEIATVIERADPDLVALQEVNRGWDVAGGVDNFAWLRWRFPEYHAVYGPMHADHFGNAILSRYPIQEWGWARYPLGPSKLPRGYVWALVSTPAGDVLFTGTHFTAFNRGEERKERAAQAAELLAFWRGRPRAVLVGDFNDSPDSEAIRALMAGGVRDVLAAHGAGATPTYSFTGTPFIAPYSSKLDYVFTSPDVSSSGARVLETTASDHRPVLATLRLR